jgi:photosystem II stability/assembly factor-like uncharacterized protein
MKKLYILLVALVTMNGAMAQWVPQNSGTTSNLNSVYFTDSNTGFVVGDSGIILKSIDGGNNWAIQSSGTFANLFSVQFADSLTGYAVGDSSIILKTIDGGDNWVNQSVGVSADFSSVSFPTVDTGYVVGFYRNWLNSDTLYNYILKTTNGGNLWTTSYLYKTTDDVGEPYVKSVFFPDVNTGYAVGARGSMMYYPYLVKTIDGGMNWTSQAMWNFMYYGILSAHFLNTDTGYLVGYGGYSSLKTINGGNDWTGLISNDYSTHYSVYFIDSERGYLVGGKSWSNGNIIKYTEDGGNVWITQYSDNLPGNYLLSVNFANNTTGYAVGTNGVILKTTNGGSSSGCLPEGITFTTQEQIDNFQTNYPGCREIEGIVNIGDWMSGSNITNLNGLSVLTSVGGGLNIGNNPALTSLIGLDNLNTIGGDFWIYWNQALTSLLGLDNVSSIGGLLGIDGNDALTNLEGLDHVSSIGGDLRINDNSSLSNLTGIENLASIGGDLSITYTELTDLSGLNNLVSLGGDIIIGGNYSLTSLTGLEGLTSVTGSIILYIFGDNCYIGNSLQNLTGLDNITSIGGDLDIRATGSLINLTGLNSLISANNLIIGRGKSHWWAGTSLVNLNGLENLTTITGELFIDNSSHFSSLEGIENLNSIEGNMTISNSGLSDFSVSSSLSTIGDNFVIKDNSGLTSLAGLNNLSSIGGDLTIAGNPLLSECDASYLCIYLSNPNGSVNISNNYTGCNSPDEVKAACTFSVEPIGLDNQIHVYPNPADKTVTISGNNLTAIREIFIYNQTGQKILQSKPVNNTLDISKLRPGMYIVELVTDQGKMRNKLIIE